MTSEKANLTIKKALGTCEKVLSMNQDDKYCIDIIQQINSAIGMLNSAKNQLLEGHLNSCLESKIKENKKQTIDELIKVFNYKDK